MRGKVTQVLIEKKSGLIFVRSFRSGGLSPRTVGFVFLEVGRSLDEALMPRRRNSLGGRTHAAVVGKLHMFPRDHLRERFGPVVGRRFGMYDFAIAKKNQAALFLLHHLNRAASPAQTTHLQDIEHVEEVRCAGSNFLGALDG